MGQRGLPWQRLRATADQPGRRDRVRGARNGRSVTRPAPGRTPAMPWIRVTSIASARDSGGRIDGSRCASIVLPVPGGPASKRLWPPAAAIASARSGPPWPRTSARSRAGPRAPSRHHRRMAAAGRRSPRAGSPRPRRGRRRRRRPGPRPVPPPARGRRAAQGRPSQQRPCPRPPRARHDTDAARRPARGSPKTATRSRTDAGSWPTAASTPQATARSKPGPSLRSAAGARLTVIRRAGNSKPELRIAERTRSRDSRTARSPSPTIVNAGSPGRMSTSTVTRRLSTPWIAKVVT